MQMGVIKIFLESVLVIHNEIYVVEMIYLEFASK